MKYHLVKFEDDKYCIYDNNEKHLGNVYKTENGWEAGKYVDIKVVVKTRKEAVEKLLNL